MGETEEGPQRDPGEKRKRGGRDEKRMVSSPFRGSFLVNGKGKVGKQRDHRRRLRIAREAKVRVGKEKKENKTFCLAADAERREENPQYSRKDIEQDKGCQRVGSKTPKSKKSKAAEQYSVGIKTLRAQQNKRERKMAEQRAAPPKNVIKLKDACKTCVRALSLGASGKRPEKKGGRKVNLAKLERTCRSRKRKKATQRMR